MVLLSKIDLHQNNLFLNRVCNVRGVKNAAIKRILLEFSFEEIEVKIEELVIEISRHNYTNAYINLTKKFYLKM